MQRYFFHLYDTLHAPDEEGTCWPNDRSALENALAAARDVASAEVRCGTLNLDHFIVVETGDGRQVGTVKFGDAVKVFGA